MAENPQKKSIPFIEILKRAGIILWQHRFLLWFGLLMALGSPGSFNFGGNEKDLGIREEKIRNFFEMHWQIIAILAVVLVAIGIILFLVSLVAKAGLVKSANLISRDKKTDFKKGPPEAKASFRAGWRAGKKYLGKLFATALLFFLATFIVIIVLVVPVVYLAMAGSTISAVLVGLLAVSIFIPLIFIFSLTKAFAEFYIILSDLGLRSAIETGYDLLLKNVLNSITFALLLFAVSMAAFLILLPVAGIALIILVPMGTILYFLNKIAFGIFVAFAGLIILGLILFISAIFQAYKTTAWTLFFQEIAKVEKSEIAETAEEKIEEPIAATPEKA